MKNSAKNKGAYFFLLAALLILLFIVSLSVGPVTISLKDTYAYFFGQYNPVVQLRLMRAVMAVITACGLAAAGVILQGLLRNPLADPYVLGISAGSATGAVIAIISGLNMYIFILPVPMLFAFIGAVISIFVVYRLAIFRGRLSVQNLVLAGIAVNALLSSLLLFTIYASRTEAVHGIVWWLLGSFQLFEAKVLVFSGSVVFICLLASVPFLKELNAISLGEDTAVYVGVNVEFLKTYFFVIAGILTAAIVSSVGMIGFVGLVIPHIARKLFGPDTRYLFGFSILIGAIFLILSDIFCRMVFAPAELPVGVVTSLVGAPFFIFVLIKTRNEQ
ncbi:MAG: iron ABC transporter permease [bacterium]|nr:iron ABC transporter permease [bacterium]